MTADTAGPPHDDATTGESEVPEVSSPSEPETVTSAVDVHEEPGALVAAAPAASDAGPLVDPVGASAVEVARAVAVEAGGAHVGEHLGVEADDDLVVTHSFASTQPGYVGWRWAVTVARVEGSDEVTVDEVVLLPGSGALLAPAWVPYSERVQPGDLSPGDLLVPETDDPRLVPAYASAGTQDDLELASEVFWELGLGRTRVLSLDGRLDTATRWYEGDRGPDTPSAKQAPASCLTCGFRLPMGGELRATFGVCANAFAPDDGRVVSLDHGCGAHSETEVALTHQSADAMVVEDDEFEMVPVAAATEEAGSEPAQPDDSGDETADASPTPGFEPAEVDPDAVEPAAAEPAAAEEPEAETPDGHAS